MNHLADAREMLTWGREAMEPLWEGDHALAPRLKHDLRLDPAEGQDRYYLVAFNIAPFPHPIIKGVHDAIGHLRHSLNLAVSSLSEAIVGKSLRNTDFPFNPTEQEVRTRLAKSRIPAVLHGAILDCQPWDAINQSHDDTLRRLALLSNEGKHANIVRAQSANIGGTAEFFHLEGVAELTGYGEYIGNGEHRIAIVKIDPHRQQKIHAAGIFHPGLEFADLGPVPAAIFLKRAAFLFEQAIDNLETAALPHIQP